MATRNTQNRELLLLCFGYFAFYCVTGLLVKLFTGPVAQGFYGLNEMQYLLYNTFGGNLTCLVVVFALGWAKFKPISWLKVPGTPWKAPSEFAFLIPSGLCTAVVVPATTLMYMLPISVMVAMVIMRGSIIVVSRLVDEIQIRQGYLDKKVVWEENVAVVFALLAVGTKIFFSSSGEHFAFVKSVPAMSILGSYIFAYFIRIYIMNYYKNTRKLQSNNRAFFAWEQVFCTLALTTLFFAIYALAPAIGDTPEVGLGLALRKLVVAFDEPHPKVLLASLSGIPYGILAFFSVFLFMFRGKTATFNGLVNRLTSLVAGTASTLLLYLVWGGHLPGKEDWLALGFILIAIGFLTASERHHYKLLTKPGLQN